MTTKTKIKILKTLLSLDTNEHSTINNFQSRLHRFDFVSTSELRQYLYALEWEHLIDIEYSGFDNEISNITLLPCASLYYDEHCHSSHNNTIVILISALTLLVTLIGIILQVVLSAK